MSELKLSARQRVLFDWVKHYHGDQKRKYTDEPYYVHLENVAKIVSQYEGGCVEIALCHDLFEDTPCKLTELIDFLMSSGYTSTEALNIASGVNDLTDEFIKEKYPKANRAERKAMEAKRLGYISPRSQSVKYADLIDNTSSIVEYDPGFARIYLQEKHAILSVMRDGNPELLEMCEESLKHSMRKLIDDKDN